MPVIAMRVKSAAQHPNADALRLYIMEAAGYEEVQIIANLENIYEVDDLVAIALTVTSYQLPVTSYQLNEQRKSVPQEFG